MADVPIRGALSITVGGNTTVIVDRDSPDAQRIIADYILKEMRRTIRDFRDDSATHTLEFKYLSITDLERGRE